VLCVSLDDDHLTTTLKKLLSCPAGKFRTDALKEADTDKDGLVNMDDFTRFYERLARWVCA
jgi:Ca2+-binding EF-hand superfamily protein